MKTLYVSDLDGTLLGSDSRVSPASAEILSELATEGALVTVATARTPATVVPLLAQTHITTPAIVMTGAAMWDWETRSYTDLHFHSPEDCQRVRRVCADCGISPFTYTLPPGDILQVYHPSRVMNSAEFSFIEQRRHLKLKRFHVGMPTPDQADTQTLLFYAMGSTDKIVSVARLLDGETDCSISAYPDIFNPDISMLEIFAPDVTKASAIRRLRRRLGADRVVVFGDNLNDIPMMREADLAVAVDNALPAVHQAAHISIGPNFTDAVAHFIREDFHKTN